MILLASVIASFITIFSLVLFLISLVNNNTKIIKIKFEKIIEEKIYAEIPTEFKHIFKSSNWFQNSPRLKKY